MATDKNSFAELRVTCSEGVHAGSSARKHNWGLTNSSRATR